MTKFSMTEFSENYDFLVREVWRLDIIWNLGFGDWSLTLRGKWNTNFFKKLK